MKVKLLRLYQLPIGPGEKTKTIGKLYVIKNKKIILTLYVLELAWKENKRNISCIKPGVYKMVKRYSPRFKNHFHIKNVKNRSLILIHIGNNKEDTRGCILPGKDLLNPKDINKEMVLKSGLAMKELNKILPKTTTIEIKWRT